MVNDIVARLRESGCFWGPKKTGSALMREAADEIERLREEVKLLNACIYSDQAAAECRTIL